MASNRSFSFEINTGDVTRLVVLGKTDVIGEDDLPAEIRRTESRIASIGLKLPEEGIDLEGVEKELLLRALEKYGWNQTQAAKYLNLSRKTLIYRMEKFGLQPATEQQDLAKPS